jgi:hypothetical protein
MSRFQPNIIGVKAFGRAVMPAKETQTTDEKRGERVREAPPEIATEYDLASFERAFERIIVRPEPEQRVKA